MTSRVRVGVVAGLLVFGLVGGKTTPANAGVLPVELPHSFDSGRGYLAEWGLTGEGLLAMRISAETEGWVGIGFSQDRSMPRSDMVVGAAAPDGSFSYVHDRFATARAEPAIDAQQDIEVLSITHEGGITAMEFQRPLATGDRQDFDLSDGSYFLLYAWGGRAFPNGRIGQHMANTRIVSSRAFDLSASEIITVPTPLEAGDADQDLDFDQLDLVKVQIGGKYLTGNAATWGEGDWNAAPGGQPGSPPEGDGRFNQLDIIAAQLAGLYLTGPYGAIAATPGVAGDGQTSLTYDARTGELGIDAPAGVELTSINIDSESGLFHGDKPGMLDGSFDNFEPTNLFKATFGSSFGSLVFGSVVDAGLSRESLISDFTVVGSLAGGGELGDVELIYVPEPPSLLLVALAAMVIGPRWFTSRRALAAC